MRHASVLLALALLASCTPAPAGGVPDRALRAELLALRAADQAGREDLARAAAANDTATVFRMLRADSARTRRLQALVRLHGWPTRRLAGDSAAEGAWLVLQHSPDHAWQQAMLPVLWAAARRGEAKPASVALLEDRVLVHAGRPQRWGNSFGMKDGRLVPDPIADTTGLDARRAALGLPPMAEYARVMGEMYRLPVEWPPAP